MTTTPTQPSTVTGSAPSTKPKKTARNTKGEGSIFQRADGYWYFKLVHDGQKFVKSLRTQKEREARKNAVAEKRKIIGKIERGEETPRTAENVTVGDICELYITYADRNLKAAHSVKQMFNANMRTRVEFWNKRAQKLTTADLEDYKEQRKNEGVKPATIKHELENLRAALYRAKDARTPPLIKEVPKFPMDRVENRREGFLDDAGYKKILVELPSFAKLPFVLAYHLGSRAGELFHLKWAQVHLNDAAPSTGYIDLQRTKNGKDRRAPIYFDMHMWLKWQLSIRDKQFPWCEHVVFHHDASRSNRATPGDPIVSIRRAWNSAVKRAGYPGLMLHDMRRTACRNMVQKAKIPRALAKLISGHLTDSMFERYNIVDPEDITSIGQDIEKWMSGAVESVEPPKLEA